MPLSIRLFKYASILRFLFSLNPNEKVKKKKKKGRKTPSKDEDEKHCTIRGQERAKNKSSPRYLLCCVVELEVKCWGELLSRLLKTLKSPV
jgi:hypothetical protein